MAADNAPMVHKPDPNAFELQDDAAFRAGVPSTYPPFLLHMPDRRNWDEERYRRFYRTVPWVWDETRTHRLVLKSEVEKYVRWLHGHRVEEAVEKRLGPARGPGSPGPVFEVSAKRDWWPLVAALAASATSLIALAVAVMS